MCVYNDNVNIIEIPITLKKLALANWGTSIKVFLLVTVANTITQREM